jgi:ubiquinone/menaquinone biosynthesis C-methylase UbiE
VNRSEFDKFADEYSSLHSANIAISGEAPDYFADYKIRDLARAYRAHCGAEVVSPALLDFGAGVGTSVPHIRKHLPNARLTCLDVSEKSLDVGRGRFAGQADFVHFEGGRIPFPDQTFDIVFAACVFHHIDHTEHVRLLTEIHRVLAVNGIVFIFEHNPLNPLTVHAVNTCEFDANARLIRAGTMRERLTRSGFRRVRTSYRVFFPRALRAFRPLERRMTWLPLGAQYYAFGIRG